jgi:glycosyltransferase involved in cell wall biosynthesis
MGRPIVATRTGGAAELVADGETGLLFTPGDAGALARHLPWLERHPAERAALGRRARRRVEERFSLDRHPREIESLYRESVARGGASAGARGMSRALLKFGGGSGDDYAT